MLYLSQITPDGTNDGPRISDEVWKLLWYRALQAERQEQLGVATTSRAPSSLAFRSASLPGNLTPSSSSPFPFDREFSSSLSSLSTTPTPTPVHNSHPSDTPSDTDTSTSTTTSTTSNPSPSTANTGFTSLDNESTHTRTHPDLLAIASDLTPNPFLPILAKVEFDIDVRKAKWYDGWLKARKDRAKWKASTANANANTNFNLNTNVNASSIERLVPLPLELPDLAKSRSRFDSLTSTSDDDREKEKVHDAALKRIGYALLHDGDNDGDGDGNHDPNSANSVGKTATQDSDAIAHAHADEDEIDATVKIRIPLLEGGPRSGGDGDRDIDPLADVFGTDADTWDAMKHEAPLTRRNQKPRDLALVIEGDGPDADEGSDPIADDEGEVLKLWSDHQKPTLKLKNEGVVAPLAPRRPAPPPLKIAPPTASATSISGNAGPRSAFPVMQRSFSETNLVGKDGNGVNEKRMKHRTGIVFGDGDGLGFGFGVRAGKFIEESIAVRIHVLFSLPWLFFSWSFDRRRKPTVPVKLS